MNTVSHLCLACSKEFSVPKGGAYAGKYCSRDCMSAGFSRKVKLACALCGTLFFRSPSHVRKTNYCSRICKDNAAPRHVFGCLQCGKLTSQKRYRAAEAKFCSTSCASRYHDRGLTESNYRIRRSAEYQSWRQAVFTRDNYTCRLCGKRGGELNADHIRSFAYHPESRFDVENGRTLCVPCHRKTENYGRMACIAVAKGY